MAKTRPKPQKKSRVAAVAFLKNGSKNAAKALKRSSKQVAKPPRVEKRRAVYGHGHGRHGRPDPTLVVKEAVAKSKHQTYYEIVENTEKKDKKLEFEVRSFAPFE